MTYIIGEIGQNHNGSVGLAKAIVDLAQLPIRDDAFDLDLPGLDAIKLTKRDLNEELTATEMSRPYNSPNSFGKTYGEHRAYLELSDDEHFEIYQYAKEKGLEVVETLCARACLSLLNKFTPDKLKVASRDLTNLPLLSAMAETKIPMIISTGMAGEKELAEAVDTISRYNDDLSILHCVSEYPTHPYNVNLRTINWLQRHYPAFTIGYSDHTVGISAPVAAVAMGAQMIEKHITLDRRLKGTDQAGSLGPDGLKRMIRDIRLIERSLGTEEIRIEESARLAKHKLERSIATKRAMNAGEVIMEEDLMLLSPGTGFRWTDKAEVIGKTLRQSLPQHELILQEHLEG